jgi:hypothetical protein
MMLDLTEEEIDALAKLLSRTIDDDRYPLSAIAPHSDLEDRSGEDPPRARPRAVAAPEGVRAAIEGQIQAARVTGR